MNFPQAFIATVLQVERNEILRWHASSLPLLNPQEFKLIGRLGSGASGSVYLAQRNNTSEVAIKVYHKESGEDIKYEASILSILQGTGFVPQIYGFLTDPSIQGKTMLVQELFGKGRILWSILYGRDPNIVLSSANKIFIAYQLVCGLKAIHDKGVLVNDIKSDNVLVDTTSMPPYQIRYIDFNLATYGQGTSDLLWTAKYLSVSRALGLHALWLAPEVRMGHQTTRQSDIYSVGYLIAELQCPELQEIVSVCTKEYPKDRPNLNAIFNIISPLISIAKIQCPV